MTIDSLPSSILWLHPFQLPSSPHVAEGCKVVVKPLDKAPDCGQLEVVAIWHLSVLCSAYPLQDASWEHNSLQKEPGF